MNFVRNSVIIFLICITFVLGMLLLDYDRNSKINDGHFSPTLFVDGFITNYLDLVNNGGYSESYLGVGDCSHIESEEGITDLTDYDIIPPHYNDESFWFYTADSRKLYLDLFELYTPMYSPEGQDVRFRVNNYTLHSYKLSLEKRVQGDWTKLNNQILLVDSFQNGMANRRTIYYLLDDKQEENISFLGTAYEYKLFAKSLPTGNYRLVSEIGEHEPRYCKFKIVDRIEVEGFVTKEQLQTIDSVQYRVTNSSPGTFFYSTWNTRDRPRIRTDLRIFRKGVIEERPFGGFGCGTGVYVEPLLPNTTVYLNERNPLLYWISPQYEGAPGLLDSLYGDSVGVTFSLYTYSPFWSRHKPQYIYAEEVMVNTAELIHNWKQRHRIVSGSATL